MSKQKYKISVLLPTRGRIKSLEKSVTSLLSTADNPCEIEILLALDRDDTDVIKFATDDLKKMLETTYKCGYTVIAFNPIGYIRLNEYLNALSRVSQGDWLFFFNDDAVMSTKSWDTVIRQYTGNFRVLRAETTNEHPYAIFPIIPREWTDVTGYISPHQINDAWISHIAYLLDIMVDIPVFIHHERYDLTGLNHDETYKNRPMLEGNHHDPRDFNHQNWRKIRLRDATKICSYIEKKENRICDWFRDGCAGKSDIWAKMYAADVKNRLAKIVSDQ